MFDICESFLIVYECTFNLEHDLVLSRQGSKNLGCSSSGVQLFSPQIGMMTLLVLLSLVAQVCLSAFWPAVVFWRSEE